MSVEMMKNSLYNMDVRKTLFDNGIEDANDFLSKINTDVKVNDDVKSNDDVKVNDGVKSNDCVNLEDSI
jgi:hypothetical protein